MRLALGCTLALSCALLVSACGSDAKDAEPSGGAGDGGSSNGTGNGGTPGTPAEGGAAGEADACDAGCVATLAADCSNGPATQTKCVSDCRMLEAGACGGEYAVFQACAEGNPITCSAQGQPIVAACSDEQTAFIACLTQ